MWAAIFAAGAGTGAIFIASGKPSTVETVRNNPVSEPKPSPNSRRTEPAPAQVSLSAECQRALAGMTKYLDAAYAVGSVSERQLDLMSDAFEAILTKDWKKLNELAGKQRDLDRELATDKAKVLPRIKQLREDLSKCRSQHD